MQTADVSENQFSLVEVISKAVQIPGVKVNREAFLREQFKNESPKFCNRIIEVGPVTAKYPRSKLRKMALKIVNSRALVSSGASFAAGLPGGLAMAATIPADILQFYGVALRVAQEIAYLYGEEDLWCDNALDTEKVTNQLILYCGVMLGASGASQAVRVLSSSLAKQALKKLPQKALTKTFYYPIVKSIAKFFGAKMTKDVFAKGVSKAVPIVGGVVSGGITFLSMRPMGIRLIDTMDEVHFDYSQSDFESDWNDIIDCQNEDDNDISDNVIDAEFSEKSKSDDIFERIKQAKDMLDAGFISEEEFAEIKAKLIGNM